jgi:hypothetical protein
MERKYMGKLQLAVDTEAGKVSVAELTRLGNNAKLATETTKQLGMNYRQFRDSLIDVEDVAFADASLQTAIARDKSVLDAMDPADRIWVDAYVEGLGYVKV